MARLPAKIKSGQKITPLTIVAAFLGITEIVLGYAIGHVTGGVQVALAVFVMIFTLAVAGAFFAILWYRPWVFYPPSEYGDVDPQQFMAAIRQPTVIQQVELARSVEDDPDDLEAKFALIDTMADEAQFQWAIFMHESGKDAPRFSPHVYSYNGGSTGSGYFGMGGKNTLEGTGLIRKGGGGSHVALTEEGHKFAEWLLRKGRKCDFFWTPIGGWGDAPPGSNLEKWVQNTIAQTKRDRANVVPAVVIPATPVGEAILPNATTAGE